MAVSGILRETPRKTAAPTTAALSEDISGKTPFHAAAAAKAMVLPSIMDGVIRPPYAPAASAIKTTSHLTAVSSRLCCQSVNPPKVNWLPALPLPKISGNQTEIAPMSANIQTAKGMILMLSRLMKGNFWAVRWKKTAVAPSIGPMMTENQSNEVLMERLVG